MHHFMLMLLTCSAVMSLIALVYMAVNPLLAGRYAAKGRYYVWLIILAGLVIPVRPQWGGALISVGVPMEATPVVSQAGDVLPGFFLHLPAEYVPLPSAVAGISLSWWQVAFSAWLVGAVVFLSFHLSKHVGFVKRVKRWRVAITDEKLIALLHSLQAEMKIAGHIGLAVCEGIGSPVMLGFRKPQILLSTAELPQDELRFILQHELVHYKRGDLFYKCFVLMATAMHWFNPVIYLMARVINAQCELSCDAEIVQNTDGDTRQQYSEAIIGVVRYQSKSSTAFSTNFYGGKKGMKNRITSIMTTSKKRVTVGSAAVAFVLVAMLTVGTLTAFAADRPPYRFIMPSGAMVDELPTPDWYDWWLDLARERDLEVVTDEYGREGIRVIPGITPGHLIESMDRFREQFGRDMVFIPAENFNAEVFQNLNNYPHDILRRIPDAYGFRTFATLEMLADYLGICADELNVLPILNSQTVLHHIAGASDFIIIWMGEYIDLMADPEIYPMIQAGATFNEVFAVLFTR